MYYVGGGGCLVVSTPASHPWGWGPESRPHPAHAALAFSINNVNLDLMCCVRGKFKNKRLYSSNKFPELLCTVNRWIMFIT